MEADIETSVADIRLERAINHPLDTDEQFAAICRCSLFVVISSTDFLLTAWEILEEGHPDP
jgi:hypothetical protein